MFVLEWLPVDDDYWYGKEYHSEGSGDDARLIVFQTRESAEAEVERLTDEAYQEAVAAHQRYIEGRAKFRDVHAQILALLLSTGYTYEEAANMVQLRYVIDPDEPVRKARHKVVEVIVR